jgi:hypothetical protein
MEVDPHADPEERDASLLHHLGQRVGTDLADMNTPAKKGLRALAFGRRITFTEKAEEIIDCEAAGPDGKLPAVNLEVEFSILKI